MRARLLILLLALSAPAAAQFTTVTGTVTDPNGLPYAFGTISATLVFSGGAPTLGGGSYQPPTQPTGLDASGSFTMRLGDNGILSPGGSQWNFKVCSAVGTVQPAGGKGPICFSLAAPITITGATQSISANLNAVAPALTFTTASGSGTVSPNSGSAGAIAFYPAAGGSTTVNPDTLLTDASGQLTYTGNNATAGLNIQPSSGPAQVQLNSGGQAKWTMQGAGTVLSTNTGTILLYANGGTDIQFCAGTSCGNNVVARSNLTLGDGSTGGTIKTNPNCSNSGGTCTSASAGAVTIAAAATTVTVTTSAVTANSDIMLTENSAMGARLGVTCNTTTGRVYSVTAITAGTSFVITASAAPATNPACISFWLSN